MRTAATILIIILIGASASYYWYSHNQPTEHSVDFAQAHTWLVFETDDLSTLNRKLSDSASFYRSIPSLQPLVDELSDFLSPFNRIPAPGVLFVAGQPGFFQYRLIVDQDLDIDTISGPGILTTSNQYLIYSSTDITELLEASKAEELKRIRRSKSAGSNATLDTRALNLMLASSFQTEIFAHLASEYEGIQWLNFDIEDEEVFHSTSISLLPLDESFRMNANELFQYLPIETEAAILHGAEFSIFGIAACPYQAQPMEHDENLFVLFKDSNTAKRPMDQLSIYEAQLPSIEGLKLSPSWAKACFKIELGRVDVYCSSLSQAKRFKNDHLAYNRFTDSKAFRSLSDAVSESSFSLIMKTPSRHTHPTFLTDIDDDNAVNAIVIQANTEISNTKHISMAALHHKSVEEPLRVIWNAQLDKQITHGPWVFENHRTKENEIIYQDRIHQLSLMNAQGKILWTRLLGNEIIGEVKMIDGFANGKNQLLFCTSKRLFVVDRNGNDVEGFPIRIEGGITAPPLALRYASDGDLRILTPTNAGLMNYDQNGQVIEGWRGQKIGKVTSSPEWHNRAGKDYIIVQCEDHRIEILDRSGKARMDPLRIPNPSSKIYIQPASNIKQFELVYADSLGHLVFHAFSGNQKSEALLPAKPNLQLLVNVGSDYPYGFISDNRVVLLDKELNVTMDYLFSFEIEEHWKWLWKEENWIGFEDTKNKHLYVFDAEHGLKDKMPIDGSIHALVLDIDGNEIKEIITQTRPGALAAYQLSY